VALDLDAIIKALCTHAAASGWFEYVQGNPAPAQHGQGVGFGTYFERLGPAARRGGLASTSLVLVMRVELSTLDKLGEPRDRVDPLLINAVDALYSAYIGDFTLGGLIAEVDVKGAQGYGTLDTRGAWATMAEGGRFRMALITIPMVLNDVYVEVA
jgi:hypothetical protein